MIDHIGFEVTDIARSAVFYERALAPLGYVKGADFEHEGRRIVGFARESKTDFWIVGGEPPKGPVHIALGAASRKLVDAFFEAAISAGGKDNGAPGIRPHYHQNYYGAFVLDPDGINIEAVSHRPE